MPGVLANAHRPARRRLAIAAIAAVLLVAQSACALLPTSPRVKKLVDAGLAALETLEPKVEHDEKLGAKCVIGLAFYKADRPDHHLVREAISACEAAIKAPATLDNYSLGLAIVFLAEAAADSKRDLIRSYLGVLKARQKPNGGWGYANSSTGDTSQTQYAALAIWEAYRSSIRPDAGMAKSLISWLLATQGAGGEWGYQGVESADGVPAAQIGVSQTMVAAGGACLMISTDLHGLLFEGKLDAAADTSLNALPPAVKSVVDGKTREAAKPLPTAGVNWDRVSQSLRKAEGWMDTNLNMKPTTWACYYLYSVERYQSFREARSGESDLEPAWYEKGVAWLEENQKTPGVWDQQCGARVDTAFAVLFLLRSTQKSLNASFGEGSTVSGRGLPKNLAGAKLRQGRVVAEIDAVGVGDFLSMIDEGQAERLDQLASDPGQLVVGELTGADAVRLEQTLRTGEPAQRLLAATVLGRAGSLDHVPALLYGLTDPDTPVAIAARDGLRFIARRPRGFGMPDDFNDDQRYLALEKWRVWYLSLRPEATIDLGR